MAPRAKPQLSITLPRNFVFHHTEELPKTPEREVALEPQELPQPVSPPVYRIRRRTRPSVVLSGVFTTTDEMRGTEDVPIPTIEIPCANEPEQLAMRTENTEPAKGYLAPFHSTRSQAAPRTPSVQRQVFGGNWNGDDQNLGDSITRPMSACSILSDSSDDSWASSEDCPSLGGSCTSPESESGDSFSFSPVKKGKAKLLSALAQESPTAVKGKKAKSKAKPVRWTTEMDNHLWNVYMVYLQDPTVTPFKMLPGSPPPLGVCHRVTREARRTWRGGKVSAQEKAPARSDHNVPIHREESPDTIKAERSGSSTPTFKVLPSLPVWPKSGPATRRRLRELCKRKATISPHYQRLLQSRSPSPFTSTSRSFSRSVPKSSPVAKPTTMSAFSTRDIQLSLTTSTATTMQRDAPLAQLTKPLNSTSANRNSWFNDPNVPWASPAPIPSEFPSEIDHDMDNSPNLTDLPRLGSPFGYHTWGPSRSRANARPTTPRTQSDTLAQAPLRSPVQFGTYPYPSTQKRRAQHPLDEELSPGGSELRESMMRDLFGSTSSSSSRRVRSRGFSLGDVTIHDRLTAIFGPSTEQQPSIPEGSEAPAVDMSTPHLSPPLQPDSVRRLGSPFNGISGRPSRLRSRHLASASLSSYDPNALSSIDQRLGQAGWLNDFMSSR
ncbi:hypothetical protein MMC19_000050 [Ptychographa xylographoides]|nr:hypothetical protein [Ptychographa xylographoides]